MTSKVSGWIEHRTGFDDADNVPSPEQKMTRTQLIAMARDNIAHVKARTIDQEHDVLRVPAEHYYDSRHWQREIDLIFKRLPLMPALSAELRGLGDYKSIEAAGVPVLLIRGDASVRRTLRCSSWPTMASTTGRPRRYSAACGPCFRMYRSPRSTAAADAA